MVWGRFDGGKTRGVFNDIFEFYIRFVKVIGHGRPAFHQTELALGWGGTDAEQGANFGKGLVTLAEEGGFPGFDQAGIVGEA